MAAKRNYFKLGLFVIVANVLLFIALFLIGGQSLFQPRYTVETFFDESVAGLDVGSPVKFRGVNVGQVSQIEIARRVEPKTGNLSNEYLPYILVRMRLTGVPQQTLEELNAMVERGLRVQTQLAGITGQLFLSIDILDPQANPPLPPPWPLKYPYIPSAPSLTNQIVANAQRFLASLDQADIAALGQNLNRLAISLEKQVTSARMEELVPLALATLQSVKASTDRIDRALAKEGFDQTLANLRSASERLEKVLGDPALQSVPRDLAVATGQLRRMAESGELDRMVANLSQAVSRADQVIGNNQYDLRASIEDLRASMDNLRTLTEMARRFPAGVLFGEPPPPIKLPVEKK